MAQMIVWGCGKKLTEIMNSFPALFDYVDIFVDSNIDCFMGKKVHRPNILFGMKDLKVVICVYSQKERKEIWERLISEFEIGSDRIISENEWLIEELSTHKNILLRPVSVRLEAATLCQLNCVTCPMRLENYGRLGSGYLKFSDFKHFVDNNDFVRNIELSNYGEVFLNPELKEIVHYAGIKRIQLAMDNGVNLNYVDDRVIEEIVRSGAVCSMTISIDGATQEVYQMYRRNGNLYRVLENVQKINAAKEKYGSKLPILHWQYVLFEHNEGEVEKAKQMAEDLNMNIVFKLDWGNSKWVPKDREKLEKITNMKYFSREEYEVGLGIKYLNFDICRQMIFQPQINYDGRLLGCCTVRSSDWGGHNVFEVGLISALNSKIYKDAILMLLGSRGLWDEDTPCAKCRRIDYHDGGIYLVL